MKTLISAPVLLLLSAVSSLAADEHAELLFVRRIVPLLHEKCLACHGQDEANIKGGLDMRSLTGVLKGGGSEVPAICSLMNWS